MVGSERIAVVETKLETLGVKVDEVNNELHQVVQSHNIMTGKLSEIQATMSGQIDLFEEFYTELKEIRTTLATHSQQLRHLEKKDSIWKGIYNLLNTLITNKPSFALFLLFWLLIFFSFINPDSIPEIIKVLKGLF